MKCIKFPKIVQFRNVISSLSRQFTYVGLDENGDAIYDGSKPKPTLTFKGSVKLHGTNAGISYNDADGVWVQSRENVYTLDQLGSHMGFTSFVNTRKDLFELWFKQIAKEHDIDTSIYSITIFGEWAGVGIQKGVAISQLEKALYVFGLKVSKPNDVDFRSYWLDHNDLSSVENGIYNVLDFETYEIDIDFNMPQLVQNKLGEITLAVEAECPIAKALGVSGIGEGVVWSCDYEGVRHSFKVKGEKHSVSKVTKLASVDVEKLNTINEFVDYAVTQARVDQAMATVFSSPEEYDRNKTGDVIRWIISDIMAEESDVLKENNLLSKDVNKYISNKARQLFFKAMEL